MNLKDKKYVLIGCSGHWKYASTGLNDMGAEFIAAAPGVGDEDFSGLRKVLDVDFFDDYIKMLDEVRPDVAVVNSHIYRHASIAFECLNRGIHVFCEKPLALDLESLDKVIETSDSTGAVVRTMMDYRYYPEFQAVSEAVQNGLIGEPVHIFTQKSYKNGPKSEWWGLHRKSGGIISWVGSHSADWIIRCCPEKIVQVSATVSRLHNRENNELESSAACIIKFANGGQAIMSIDYLNPKTAERHGDDRLRIAGSAGVAEVINCKGEVINRDGAKELPVEEKKMIFREFVSSIYNGTEFRQSREDLIRLTTLCIKLQEAADKNAIIKTDI